MKRVLRIVLLALVFALTPFAFVGCKDTVKVESIYVALDSDVTEIAVKHNTQWDPSEELVVKAKLSDGTEKTLDGDDCDFSSIDTTKVGTTKVTVTYGAYDAEVTVRVYKYAQQIYVKSGSIDTSVNHEAVLDTTNLMLIVRYSDNTIEEISSGFVVDTPNTDSVGTNSITITYGDLTCQHNYTVNKVLKSLTVSGNYAKTHKWNGTAVSKYNYAPVTALAVWSDSETPEIVTSDKLTFSNKIIEDQKGKQTFTISYGGLTANSQPVEVYTELEEIRYFSGIADNVKYGTLNVNNVSAVAVYTDLEEKTINSTNGLVVEFNSTALGQVTVTLKYVEGSILKTTTKTTTVYEELEAIEYEAVDPATSKYFLVGSNFEKENFKYFAKNTKTRVEITDLNQISISNVQTENEQDYVIATHQGKTVRIDIVFVNTWDEVPAVSIEEIVLGGEYNKTVAHLSEADDYDYSNITVTVHYSNGMTKVLSGSEYQILPIVTSECGQTSFAVKYVVGGDEFTAISEQIEVIKTFTGLSFKAGTVLNNQRYLYGTDFLNGIMLEATYSDGTKTENISALDCVVNENYNMPTISAETHETVQILTFRYIPTGCFNNDPKEVIADVTVYEEFVKMTQEGLLLEVNYNTPYDIRNLKVYFTYTSGNKVEIPLRTETSSGYKIDDKTLINTSIVGPQALTIIYYELESPETFKVKYNLTIKVEVLNVVTGYNVLIDGKLAYDGIEEEHTKAEDIVVQVGTEFNGSIILVPQYANGDTASLGDYILSGFEANSIDTTVEGIQVLTINYNQEKIADININVIVDTATYTIIAFDLPKSISDYYQATKNTYVSTFAGGTPGFEVTNKPYMVGNDNAFKFSPIMMVAYNDDNDTVGTLSNYAMEYTLYKYENEAYVAVVDNSLYIKEFNAIAHEFTFLDSVTGKFKLTVRPTKDSTKEQSLEFEVIDGYNVYTVEELSLFDNKNLDTTGDRGTIKTSGGKWTEYKTNHGIDLNAKVNGIILHNDITITREDIPAVHFYTADELVSSDPDYDRALESLKDSDGDEALEYLYYREISKEDDTFVFEGNYFQIDVSKMPLMVRERLEPNNENKTITTHTTVFGIHGIDTEAISNADEMPKSRINNLALLGNAKKSDNPSLSGGILGFKSSGVSIDINNNLVQKFYIAYMFSTNNIQSFYDNTVINIEKTNVFDAYNTLLYVWGVGNVNINSCHFIGAGGPVMICDHVDHNNDGTGGFISSVNVDNKVGTEGYTGEKSVLESWVAGTEGWFEIYDAAPLAQQIKQLNGLYLLMNSSATILHKKDNVEYMNLITVYKSGSAQEITYTPIEGKFTNHNTFINMDIANKIKTATNAFFVPMILAQTGGTVTAEYAFKNVETYIDAATYQAVLAGITQYAAEGFLLLHDGGTLGLPGGNPEVNGGWFLHDSGLDGKPNKELVEDSTSVYVYLPNGMAATLGMEKEPA